MSIDALTAHVERVLVEELPASLKASIDRALQLGATPKEIIALARRRAGKYSLVAQGVELYLYGKTGGAS
jgi:hypothetical protein